MPTQLTEYRGFHITASCYPTSLGFLATVIVSRDKGDGIAEMKLTPPCRDEGLEKEEEALEEGVRYAKMAIDGLIPGVDLTPLRSSRR